MRAEWIRKRTGWFWDPKKSGGTAIEGVIHDFHFLPWLFGPAQRIYAEAGTFLYTDRQPTLPDDQLVVLWRFQNGAIGVIDGGANSRATIEGHTSIFFTEGGVRMGRGGGFRIYRGMLEYNPRGGRGASLRATSATTPTSSPPPTTRPATSARSRTSPTACSMTRSRRRRASRGATRWSAPGRRSSRSRRTCR